MSKYTAVGKTPDSSLNPFLPRKKPTGSNQPNIRGAAIPITLVDDGTHYNIIYNQGSENERLVFRLRKTLSDYIDGGGTVDVEFEVTEILNGYKIHVKMENNTAEPQEIPNIRFGGNKVLNEGAFFSRHAHLRNHIDEGPPKTLLVRSRDVVAFTAAGATKSFLNFGPHGRNTSSLKASSSISYPANEYSPILGVVDAHGTPSEHKLILGFSVLYNPLNATSEGRPACARNNYGRWWDGAGPTSEDSDVGPDEGNTWKFQSTFLEQDDSTGSLVRFTLNPDEIIEYDVTFVCEYKRKWIHAYREYRDYFTETWVNNLGNRKRHIRNPDPFMAHSMSQTSHRSDDNPRGFNNGGAFGWGYHPTHELGPNRRFDQYNNCRPVGWSGTFNAMQDRVIQSRNCKRVIFWKPTGYYSIGSGARNMPFEVATDWTFPQLDTLDEIRACVRGSLDPETNDPEKSVFLAFWWGRAFSVSLGWDTSDRVKLDLSDNELRDLFAAQLDAATDLGVSLMGLDATLQRPFDRGFSPGLKYQWEVIFPWLADNYPHMSFMIEPSACDIGNLLGSSYVWSRSANVPVIPPENSNQPRSESEIFPAHFAFYLNPLAEINLIYSYSRRNNDSWVPDQRIIDDAMENGYVPVVFNRPQYDFVFDDDKKRTSYQIMQNEIFQYP